MDGWVGSDNKISAYDETEEVLIPNKYCVIKSTKAIMQPIDLLVGKYALTFRSSGDVPGTVTIQEHNNPDPNTNKYWSGHFNQSQSNTWLEQNFIIDVKSGWKSTMIRFTANWDADKEAIVKVDSISLTRLPE